MAKTFDVIVLGGGPAGYVCAIRAAQLGLSTAVIEREKLGGVCVNVGCIPSKALLHSAYVAKLVKHDAKTLGVNVGDVKLDLGAAVRHSRKASEQNSKGVEFLLKKHKVTIVNGDGKLQTARKVKVGKDTYSASKGVVIATGTRVKGLAQIGLEINKTTVISSDEALFLQQAPQSLAIIGAGAVGCEFTDIFNAFDSKVTLIEVLPRILPLEDHESSEAITRSFEKRKIQVLAGAKVKGAEVTEAMVTLDVEAGGKAQKIEVEKVLMAVGRALNTESIGLEDAGVTLTDQGFVAVDQNLKTAADGIYAIGDIAGPPMLAHKGSREGVFVAEVLAGQKPRPIRYDNVPSVTYCHPEVASIGLTEEQCKKQKLDYVVGKFPLSANGRARVALETEGFVKIIRDKRYGEILGAHIVASHASELIHELTVARENEYTVEEVDLAIHAHPTLSEAVAEAVLDSLGRVIHM
ncbi:MAG: dihydrolipoyl dehydrogenase [Gemmatimonadales bacterium]|nr:dihydrolipoyl dehydrogenase [Gemmatimonadales bacterium]NIN13115.1 dihydrolipoyl dehydrogenase [Gemmatimonadales bacterium]NIN51199.1 dihydrolipoyl dehydrogenase [Gemmatimonadales bacterium]NIP08663.1 dihydrolipoyl dehydrogenase [Gemmatimonadales bacterium]NIR02351.1 dihydrolipoyl dehydrogenase [Gemmatimonadales bacterium]